MNRHAVASVAELAAGERKIVRVGEMEAGVFQTGGEYRAYVNVCPHAGAPVCEGEVVERRILRCPWHGWEFDLATGANLADPGCRLQACAVEVEGGVVYLLI